MIDEQLRFAIANKRLVQLGYLGQLRLAEPHDYGVQHGTTKLLIYQLRGSGGPRRARATGWRILTVSKIDICMVLQQTFSGSRGASYEHHLAWDEVYARVS